MIIEIDLAGETAVIGLAEPEDCKRFHVAARGGDAAALEAALEVNAVGRLLPSGDALIDTDAVRRMAEGIYTGRAFDRLPILADALLDAGCDNEELIRHCRSDGPHVRGCWAVDLILGKE